MDAQEWGISVSRSGENRVSVVTARRESRTVTAATLLREALADTHRHLHALWKSSSGPADPAHIGDTASVEEVVPEADWLDQREPVVPDARDDVQADLPADVSAADWIDQHCSLDPPVTDLKLVHLSSGVPEADALEQAQVMRLFALGWGVR